MHEELIVESTFWAAGLKTEELGPRLFKGKTNLKKLTIVKADQTILDLLPNLESLTLNQGDTSSLKGTHEKLKTLVIEHSRGEFETLHAFPNLEEFIISGFGLNTMKAPLSLEKLVKVSIAMSPEKTEIEKKKTPRKKWKKKEKDLNVFPKKKNSLPKVEEKVDKKKKKKPSCRRR